MSRGETRKEICNELARLLAVEPAGRALRLLQWTDLLRRPEARKTAPSTSPSSDEVDSRRPISIWQPEEEDGRRVFVRPPVGPLGDHFAARRRIDQEKAPGVRRICFLGESVAAGYLYAPHLTPAMILQEQLRRVVGTEAVEVVDLARTNETLRGLAATAAAARQLAPDALVVFAGNNWNLLETTEISPYVPSVGGRQEFALALRDGGLAGPVRAADRVLAKAVEKALGALAKAAGEVPVILLEPEVNLDHWEARQPVAWLPGGDTALWYRTLGEGRRRLLSGDGAGAEAAALRMLDLDGGSGPTAFRLLGRALQRQGRQSQGEEAFRREVDAERYPTLCFLGAPRITAGGRTLLRLGAERFGMHHVSLREIFREVCGGMPGRRMFLDYCHLTVEGMHVAMAAAAARLLSFWGTEISALDLARELPRPEPTPAVDGVAKLGAAVHGAHRWAGEKEGMLATWCGAALAASPAMEEVFKDVIAARCAPVPAVLTPAQGRNLESSAPMTLQHGWRWESLDVELLQAFVAALQRRGIDHGPALADALVAGTVALEPSLELTRERYLWDPLERFYPEVMTFENLTGHALLRAPWPETRFCLPAAGAGPVHLEVVARLPTIPGAEGARKGDLEILVNDRPVGRWPVAETWCRHRLRLEAGSLRRGVNCLLLRWPLPPAVGHLALEAATRRLDQGIEADLHPVFGELFSLRATGS